MAFSVRAQPTMARAAGAKRPAAVCHAIKGEVRVAHQVELAMATFATAAMLALPAQAGVILEQPALKKVFQSDAEAAKPADRPFRVPGAAASKAAPVAAAPKPKAAESSVGDGGLDPRSVALPGALIAIAGAALAAGKIDSGFNEWINESGALVRNSGAFAGFEEDIKGDNYLANKPAAGTKKVAQKKNGTQKKGSTQKKGTSFFG